MRLNLCAICCLSTVVQMCIYSYYYYIFFRFVCFVMQFLPSIIRFNIHTSIYHVWLAYQSSVQFSFCHTLGTELNQIAQYCLKDFRNCSCSCSFCCCCYYLPVMWHLWVYCECTRIHITDIVADYLFLLTMSVIQMDRHSS